jgi:hypothetical protein
MAQHKTAGKSGGTGRASVKSLKKAESSRPAKSGIAKRGGSSVTETTGEEEVSLDRRRGDRRAEEAAAPENSASAAPQLERRKKVSRRRQIDPTTCERDYTEQEVEFMNALDDYKRRSGRMFPTCSEVLEVVRSLGYVKLSPAEMGTMTAESSATPSAKPMPSDWSAAQETRDEAVVAASADTQAAW